MGGRLQGRSFLGMITGIKRERVSGRDYYNIEWYNGPQRGVFEMYDLSHEAVNAYRQAYLKHYGKD